MQDTFSGHSYFMTSLQAFGLWQYLPVVVESEVPGDCTVCHCYLFIFQLGDPITVAQMVFLNSYNGLYPFSCIILMRITDWFYEIN